MNIDKLRNEMNYCIQKYGINAKETMKISQKLDNIVLKELKIQICKDTMHALIEYSKINDFPSAHEWDIYAKENGYLSHISLKYKLGLKWNEIKNIVISKIE